MPKITKYGLDFDAEQFDMASVEAYMIKKGGQWTDKGTGRLFGNGLFYHYKSLQSILWPEDVHHRWSDLALASFLKNEISVMMGSGDSNKTYAMSRFALCDYWTFPDKTLWLISSTEYRGAELRIWGKIKELFNRAKERFPWLDGNVLESMHAITTDAIDDERQFARSLQRGMILVPCKVGSSYVGLCFPPGTHIDVPGGSKPIEHIKPGEVVISAIGPRRVQSCSSRICDLLVRVHLSNGTHIDCTPNHPFLTASGWVNAIDIPLKTELISARESLQIVRDGFSKIQKVLLQPQVPAGSMEEGVRILREVVHPLRSESDFLFEVLFGEMEMDESKVSRDDYFSNRPGESFRENPSSHHGKSPRAKTKSGTRCLPKGRSAIKDCQTQLDCSSRQQREVVWSLRQRWHTDQRRITLCGILPGSDLQCGDFERQKTFRRLSALLQARFRMEVSKAGSRNRWGNAHTKIADGTRRSERRNTSRTRVERVEILERAGDERFCDSEGGYRVHNIEVEGHPSYCIQGLVVHNSAFVGVKAPRLRHAGDEIQHMSPGFLDAYSNWYGKADFKGLMAGNPLDTTDPLGVAAEPEAGWDVFEDTKKTQEWTSKFFGAHVIAFDGRDSPNFDFPQDQPIKYPFLISNKKLDAIRKTHGENSWQWFNQCVGKPNKNLVIWRVITKQICEQHKAFDRAIWAGTKHTWIYALDPAYGGIDRCIGMPIEFGEDIDNRQILRCYPPELVPINLALDVTVEDQIAGYIFKRSQSLVIPPENIFYDSFGRGTLGFAFARFFGRSCPVPVDSGAQPTTRPVRYDLYIDDGDKTKHQDRKRLKRCNEHYSKFVTEMWFSVRECVESEQMRELPKDVMEEGCQRLYSVVKGDRVEVESKDDMKERIGKSPDLFDTLAIGIEGARQRGFHIKRIGGEIETSLDIPDWMLEEAAKQQQILKGALLEHAI